MYLIETASFILAIILFHSFLGKLGVLKAFLDPQVHAIALRELTAIHKRVDLEAVFGPHDGAYRFTAPPGAILAARPWWRWIIGNLFLEAVLIYALLSVVFGNITPSLTLVIVAVGYYALAHFLVIRGFKSVRPEVEEEIAFGEQKRRDHLDKLMQEKRRRDASSTSAKFTD